jgi:hypothetical protein
MDVTELGREDMNFISWHMTGLCERGVNSSSSINPVHSLHQSNHRFFKEDFKKYGYLG